MVTTIRDLPCSGDMHAGGRERPSMIKDDTPREAAPIEPPGIPDEPKINLFST